MHSSDPDAVYPISSAARLVGMHANTLRKYERQGLIFPSRTSGNLRLFSPTDLARLRQIKHLVEDRCVNLAGVETILSLTDRVMALRRALVGEKGMSGAEICQHLDEILVTLYVASGHPDVLRDPMEDAGDSRGTRFES